MRPKKLPALSETQMEIMRQVWASGEVTVTEVCDALNHNRPVARNTILTLMDRLARRGWLKRRLDGQTHYYSARSPRSTTLRDMVSRMIDTAFGGSAEELVVALLHGRRLTQKEVKRIGKLIDQAKKDGL